jgi:hypothetical protein
MKKYIKIITLFILAFCFQNCQDVVDVPLNTDNPKFVIEASIRWIKGTAGNTQTIKITKTGDFYKNTVPPVNGAVVKVTNSTNVVFDFIEQGNTGNYVCTNFIPVINEVYTLVVQAEGQTFKGTETLIASPAITNTTQQNDVGFDNKTKEFKFFFQDNPNERNFYLEYYNFPYIAIPEFGVIDDEFTNGNQMFILLFNKKLNANDVFKVSLEGISERYAKYTEILVGIAGGQTNGPFATSSATIRGNIVNQTNEKHYPFGYFRLSEVTERVYTVQ